jgi:hypothetical protein
VEQAVFGGKGGATGCGSPFLNIVRGYGWDTVVNKKKALHLLEIQRRKGEEIRFLLGWCFQFSGGGLICQAVVGQR